MPRDLTGNESTAIDFGAFIDAVESSNFDARDEGSLASLAPLLARLSNNRDFLGEAVIAELESCCAAQAETNRYGLQVLMLYRSSKFFIRANFWPAEHDSLVRSSGTRSFFYDVPHDHNFHFLTVGYDGPGYWSDYYDYDYDGVAGYPGEPVGLRFVERSRLERGRILLYRAHRDIHRQLPPDALSVSLNIIGSSLTTDWRDQYRFDLEGGTIDGVVTTLPSAVLMRLALAMGGETGEGLVEDFARRHPSDHMRFDAVAAQAAAASSDTARISVLERAARDQNAQFAGWSRAYLETSIAQPKRVQSHNTID